MRARYAEWLGPSAWYAVMIGCLLGGVVVLGSTLSGKWSDALTLSVVTLLLLPIVRPRLEHGILLYFVLIDLHLDIYPIYFDRMHDFAYKARGIPIQAADFPLLVMAFTVLIAVVRGEKHVPLRPLLPAFVVVAIIMELGMVRSGTPLANQIGAHFFLLKTLMASLVVMTSVDSSSLVKWAVAGLLASIALNISFGVLQVFTKVPLAFGLGFQANETITEAGGVMRIGGILGSQAGFSKFLGLGLPVVFSLLFIRHRSWWFNPAILVALSLGLFANIKTYCRGGWVGLGIGLTLTMVLCVNKFTGRASLAALAPGALLVIAVLVVVASPKVNARVFGDDGGTSKDRIAYAGIAARMAANNPLLGVGFGWYVPNAFSYDRTENLTTYRFQQPVHNEYLLVAAELGIPTLLIYLSLLLWSTARGLSLRKCSSKWVYIGYGMMGGLAGYCVQDLFEWSWVFTSMNFWVRIGLLHSIVAVARSQNTLGELKPVGRCCV